MVDVELAGDVNVIGGHVGQGFVTDTECTVTNLIVEQVGQSLVMVSVELGVVTVAEVFDSIVVEPDPGIVIGGQVGQGLYTVAVEFDPGILIGGQVGQGLYSVSVEPDPGIVIGGQVGQGLYTVVLALDPEIVVIGQVGQALVTVVETLTPGAIWPEGEEFSTNGTPVLR